jgi:hypothetical protein
VIDCIANHVQQRIFEVFEDAGIHLDIAAYDFQPRELVVALGNIPHRAGELLKQRPHRNQADPHHLFLQVLLQVLGFAMQFEKSASRIGLEFLDRAPQTTLGNGNLAGEVEHAIEFLDVDAKSAVPGVQGDGPRNRCGGGHFGGSHGLLCRFPAGNAGHVLLQLLMGWSKPVIVFAFSRRGHQSPQGIHGLQKQRDNVARNSKLMFAQSFQ